MTGSRIVALLAVAGVMVPAGCGGSSSPAKARYVAEANAICKAASARTGPLIDDVTAAAASITSGGAGATGRLANDLEALHRVASEYVAKLKRLRQPSGDHAAIQRFLTPFAKIVDSLGAAAAAVTAGQMPQALALLEHAAPVAQAASSGAQAYSLDQCATVVPPLG
jgi:hypothetical protein